MRGDVRCIALPPAEGLSMLNESLYESKDTSWATPQWLFDVLSEEFKFDLDPCADVDTAKCTRFFASGALEKDWKGSVFMNPPYGRAIGAWVSKARSEVAKGNALLAVCLVPARTDTRWWHDNYIYAAEIRLLNKRLTFAGATNKAPFPVALIVFKAGNYGPPILSTFHIGSQSDRGAE